MAQRAQCGWTDRYDWRSNRIVAANRLSYTWQLPNANGESDKSRVTFELETVGDAVKLTVVHDKLEKGSDMASKISQGRPLVLSSLKSFLETGQALDIWAMKGSCSAQESAKEKVAR